MTGEEATRLCPKCGEDRPVRTFHKRGDKRRGTCGNCRMAKGPISLERRVALRANSRRHYEKNREREVERAHVLNVFRRYGLKDEDYWKLFEKQGGVCASCRRPEEVKKQKYSGTRRLSVDHDHETGVVRGLLCARCNAALGLLRDDPSIVGKLLQYLIDALEDASLVDLLAEADRRGVLVKVVG